MNARKTLLWLLSLTVVLSFNVHAISPTSNHRYLIENADFIVSGTVELI
jgi:hypothetical protein